jgi:hypothetical protein
MDQHDRLATAVILVVNFDRGIVLGSNSDARHGLLFCSVAHGARSCCASADVSTTFERTLVDAA